MIAFFCNCITKEREHLLLIKSGATALLLMAEREPPPNYFGVGSFFMPERVKIYKKI